MNNYSYLSSFLIQYYFENEIGLEEKMAQHLSTSLFCYFYFEIEIVIRRIYGEALHSLNNELMILPI